jgi:hypothetical protein
MSKRSKFGRGHDPPKERRKRKMAEDQKNTPKEFMSFFQGTPCADMMRKMVEARKAGHGFNCAEIISQMMQMCSSLKDKREKTIKETQESKP